MRARLGESLASVQKFDVPIEATTPSLEALEAISHQLSVAGRIAFAFLSRAAS